MQVCLQYNIICHADQNCYVSHITCTEVIYSAVLALLSLSSPQVDVNITCHAHHREPRMPGYVTGYGQFT